MAKKKRRQKRREFDTEFSAPDLPITSKVTDQIREWAVEAAEAGGLVLFDVEVTKGWIVRAFVDRPGAMGPGQGVTVDECVAVSRYMEALLDIEDAVPEKYTIEVSSPGVERPLTEFRQYPLVVGRTVKVVLKESINGINVYEGELVAAKDDVISIRPKTGDIVAIGFQDVAKARLTYEF